MTHSNLLRVFSYLGLKASQKNLGTNLIAVFPSPIPVVFPLCRIQLVDSRSTLLYSHNYTKGDSRYSLLVAARRGACLPMGQANSFVRGYSGTDENACSEKLKERADFANPSKDVNGSVESQNDQKASVDEVANIQSISEVVVSPEQVLTSQLDKKLETDLASEDRSVSETTEIEVVKKEVEKKAQTDLNLELELGEPPERPLPGDCCGQGCDVCVWDTYNDELRDYLARKKSLLAKSE